MKVSIITAAFNSEQTIADTLESVASQTYPGIEHIVIDGLSKDRTVEIARGYPHVSRVISEKDRGIYDAMNKGISLATGDIIGLLNSDDFYAGNKVIEDVARVFEQTGCDAVYGDLVYVQQGNVEKQVRYWKAGAYRAGAFKWGWMPPHPAFFVRKQVYEELGMFGLDLGTSADYELMLRFIHKNGIALSYLPKILVKMREGGASNASLFKRLSANKADRIAWRRNHLKPFWFTLYLKPLRKIGQFLFRGI